MRVRYIICTLPFCSCASNSAFNADSIAAWRGSPAAVDTTPIRQGPVGLRARAHADYQTWRHRLRGSKELRDPFLVDMAMDRVGIVDAVRAQQRFVAGEKCAAGGLSIVPDQRSPAAGSQDAPCFDCSVLDVEPMKRLTRNDQIGCVMWKCRDFRGPRNTSVCAAISSHTCQVLVACQSHCLVRLDPDHRVAAAQEWLCRQSRADSDDR